MAAKKYALVNFSNAILSAVINFMMPALIGVENASELQTFRRNVTTFSPILDLGNSYEVARCGQSGLNVQLMTLSLMISLIPVIGLLFQTRILQADSDGFLLVVCGVLTVIVYNCIAVNVAQKELVRSAWINMIAAIGPTVVAIAIYKCHANALVGFVVAIFIVAVTILAQTNLTFKINGGGKFSDNIKFGLPKALSGALETAYLLPIINSIVFHDWAFKIVFFSQVGRFVGGVINSNLVYARVSESGLSSRDLVNVGLAIFVCGCIFVGTSFILPAVVGFRYYASQNANETVFLVLIMFGSTLGMAVSGYLNLKYKIPYLGILNFMALTLTFVFVEFNIYIVELVLATHVVVLLLTVFRIFKNERIRR